MINKDIDNEPMLEETSDEVLLEETSSTEAMLEEASDSEVLLEEDSSESVLLEEDSEVLLEKTTDQAATISGFIETMKQKAKKSVVLSTMDEQKENVINETSQVEDKEQSGRLYSEASTVDIAPSIVKLSLSKMSEEKQSMFVEEFKRKKKSLGLAYFFLIICLGMPYGYLGKWGLQIVYWLTGMGGFLWFFYLLFALPGLVRDYNQDVASQIVRDLKNIG